MLVDQGTWGAALGGTKRSRAWYWRLIAFDETGVTFGYKDDKRGGPERGRITTFATDDFIRRFLIHCRDFAFLGKLAIHWIKLFYSAIQIFASWSFRTRSVPRLHNL